METWRVELTASRKGFTVVKIQRGIFQGDSLSPLLFVIAMMPLSHLVGYKLSKSQKINHLMYVDDIKLFAKNEREWETLIQVVIIYSQDIGMEFGIEKGAMQVMKSIQRLMTEKGELPNQEKEILEADTIRQLEMEKMKKEYSGPVLKWLWEELQ